MQRRLLVLSIALAGISLAACGDDDSSSPPPASKKIDFTASMTPAGEPGTLNNNPTGSGTFTATLDTSTNVFTWTSTFSGLTTNINNGHIHGPFPNPATPTATSAGVLLNFNPTVTPTSTFTGLGSATSGGTTGTVTLNSALVLSATVNGDSLRKLILAGLTYINIHTTANAGGEIRGQLTRK